MWAGTGRDVVRVFGEWLEGQRGQLGRVYQSNSFQGAGGNGRHSDTLDQYVKYKLTRKITS